MKTPIIKTFLSFLLILLFLPTYGQKKAKLTSEEKENLKTAKVLLVRYEAPPLYVMTPKSVVGQGLMAKLTDSDVADKRERYRYYPNAIVHKNLDSLFRATNLMSNIEIIGEAQEFMMPSELKDLSKYKDVDADYIIEVIVPLMGWKASYAPIKWKIYHLNLGVELRIIRKSDLKRIWKTNVGYGGLVDKEMRFHISELENGGKEMIRTKLNKMAYESSKRVIEKYIKAKK